MTGQEALFLFGVLLIVWAFVASAFSDHEDGGWR